MPQHLRASLHGRHWINRHEGKNSKGEMGEAYTLSIGGSQGKDPQIGEVHQKAIPAEDIQNVLRQVLIEQFGAKPRA
jgi:ferredoxin-nitrite reductase